MVQTKQETYECAAESGARRTAGGFHYLLSSDHWNVSNGVNFNFKVHRNLQHLLEYKEVLAGLLETHSASYCGNIHSFTRDYIKHTGRDVFSIAGLSEYRAYLGPSGEHRLGHIKAFLLLWEAWGYPGIGQDLSEWLVEQKIKGNVKGRAVRTDCPYSGAFSPTEKAAILEWSAEEFRDNGLSLGAFAALYLPATSGQRPVQICNLKTKDLVSQDSSNPNVQAETYALDIPVAKQARSKFRKSMVQRPINHAMYQVTTALINENRRMLNALIGSGVEELSFREFPLFPYWPRVRQVIKGGFCPKAALRYSLRERPSELHMHTNEFCKAFYREEIRNRCPVVSEQTGERLLISPRRFRYTFGTDCVRMGLRGTALAAALMQSDTQNIWVYVHNTPEQSARIDELMTGPLNIVAQALSGTLVDNEQDAKRGDDPSARIQSEGLKNIGTCGSFEFCVDGYRSCYTCRKFQPWLDAPHEEPLSEVLAERAKMVEQGCSELVIKSSDRLISAIRETIRRCKARQEELASEELAIDE